MICYKVRGVAYKRLQQAVDVAAGDKIEKVLVSSPTYYSPPPTPIRTGRRRKIVKE